MTHDTKGMLFPSSVFIVDLQLNLLSNNSKIYLVSTEKINRGMTDGAMND